MVIKFEVAGHPMGKQRPKVAVLGASKFAHAYTPKETTTYESNVVFFFKQKCKEIEIDLKDGTPFKQDEEIWATIKAYFPITKNHYRWHKKTNTLDLDKDGQQMLEGSICPTKKPDCDNIAKICLDALNGIAYPDDSQITTLLVMKLYSEQPKVVIELESKKHYGIR